MAKILTAEQCRVARASLNLGLRDLARRADVVTTEIRRVEAGGIVPEPTLVAIREALEWAGAEFTSKNGGGQGVRLR